MKNLFKAVFLATALATVAFASPASAFVVTTTELGTLGGNNEIASYINESGQIAGESWNMDAGLILGQRGFIWQDGVLTDLGDLGGGDHVWVRGINDAGQVTGASRTATTQYAYIWENGVMTSLGAINGNYSFACDINNAGAIVGYSGALAFIWQDGVMTDLGAEWGEAHSINDAGLVVGWTYDSRNLPPSGYIHQHAFIWINGTVTELGTLGGYWSAAVKINEAGQVIGWSTVTLDDDIRNDRHAFIVTPEDTDSDGQPDNWYKDDDANGVNDLMVDLGTMGGDFSEAVDINNTGQVVGWSAVVPGGNPNYDGHSFIITPADADLDGVPDTWYADDNSDGINDLMTDLGLYWGFRSRPTDINEAGYVVGNNEGTAYIWGEGVLSAFGGYQSSVYAINESGQTVGTKSVPSGGEYHPVLWEVELPLQVGIDIVPYDPTNTVDISRAKTVPVAILSSASFDATAIDVSSVTLDGASVKQRKNGAYLYSLEDTNADGLTDIVCEIDADQLTLTPGVFNMLLKGSDGSARDIRGRDLINLVP